jgi:hypothetical protein
MQWHFRNVEFANAAALHTLSLRGWDQDDPYEMLGPHVLLPGQRSRLCTQQSLRIMMIRRRTRRCHRQLLALGLYSARVLPCCIEWRCSEAALLVQHFPPLNRAALLLQRPGGNGRLVEALLQEVPVAYSSVVRSIEYGGDKGVVVSTDDASYAGEAGGRALDAPQRRAAPKAVQLCLCCTLGCYSSSPVQAQERQRLECVPTAKLL